jgi:iron complex transport system substrate-binding protein
MRTICSAIVFVLFAGILTACTPVSAPATSAPPIASDAPAATAALVVEDAVGRSVEFETPPSRIVVVGRGTYMVTGAIFTFPAAQDRVAGFEGGRFNDPANFLPFVAPSFAGKSILERNAGPEQVAPVRPDALVLKSTARDELGAALEQLGIPIVYVEMESVEQYFDDITTLGQLLDSSERAQEIIGYMQERLDRVADGLADVIEADKPSVLVIQYSDEGGEVAFEVPPASWLQTRLVELAGGVPVWTEASPGGGWATVNFEQVAQWNPDKVVVIYYQADSQEAVAALAANPEWQALAATQNGELYGFPADIFGWDSPDPRWILGLQWLATKLHPERFADLDIMAEVDSFFNEIYGMDSASIEANILPMLKGDLP